MTFQDATEKFAKFKSTGAPTLDGVKFKSRGVVYDLEFDLQLVDGKVAVTAKVAKDVRETEQPKASNKRK